MGMRGRSGLRSAIQSSTSVRKPETIGPHASVPLAISSSSDSIRAVNETSTTSEKCCLR